MSQKLFPQCVQLFVQAVRSFHQLLQLNRASLTDISKRVDMEMTACDQVKQSGEPLAKMLAKNHAAESEDVFKMVHYIAEGGGADNANAIWPDLRARLKRLAVGGPERTEFAPIAEDLDILEALAEAHNTLIQSEIKAVSGQSLKVIKKRLPVLDKAGLTDQPHGQRKGHAITSNGRGLLNSRRGPLRDR